MPYGKIKNKVVTLIISTVFLFYKTLLIIHESFSKLCNVQNRINSLPEHVSKRLVYKLLPEIINVLEWKKPAHQIITGIKGKRLVLL